MNSFEARFGGVARLVGWPGLRRLQAARVCVVGLGGVGSWAAEALARSGVGSLTLVDFDEVCISNVNRQLHAMTGKFGRPKVEVMAHRIEAIHPDCTVRPLQSFLTASNARDILGAGFDHVVDAIDRPAMKTLLIACCRELGVAVVSAGAAGGRRDPTAIRVTDLSRVTNDRLLRIVRKTLRSDHGFPRGSERFGVDCVHSMEAVVHPTFEGDVSGDCGTDVDLRLDCRMGYGTATYVTGVFGFVAAGCVVRALTEGIATSRPRCQDPDPSTESG